MSERSETSDLQQEMQRRIWRHLSISFAGAIAGFVFLTAVNLLIGDDPARRPVLVVCVIAGLVLIPLVGFTSARRLLRCPACNGNVGFQVSANVSAFARSAKKTCNHCEQRIFR